MYTNSLFHQVLSEIAVEQQLRMESFSNNWIHILHKNTNSILLIGLNFPLNQESSSALAKDKTATAILLQSHSLPVIDHTLISFVHRYTQQSYEQVLETVERIYGYPMVIKPNVGSEGKDVFLVKEREDLVQKIRYIHEKESTVAVSPYMREAKEYRVVVLSGVVQTILEKKPAPKEWRHNLSLGATAQLVVDESLLEKLSQIALHAAKIMRLNLASVDIMEDRDGNCFILEVNSTLSLLHFAKQDEKSYLVAKKIYTACVEQSFLQQDCMEGGSNKIT